MTSTDQERWGRVKDRLRAEAEYQVNLKAELEVAQLHEKVDFLTEEVLARTPRRANRSPDSRRTARHRRIRRSGIRRR